MTTLAWHFTTYKLRDGRLIPPAGKWLEHHGLVSMCASGLHASRRLIDALAYAPCGSKILIHRVEVDEVYDEWCDKLVARRRKILWTVNGTGLLAEFAKRCALSVVRRIYNHKLAIDCIEKCDEDIPISIYPIPKGEYDAWECIASCVYANLSPAHKGLYACIAARYSCRAGNGGLLGSMKAENRRLTAMVSAAPRLPS